MRRLVKLHEFYSVCLSLMQKSGAIIRDVHTSGALQTTVKSGQQDVVTKADLQVQHLLSQSLKSIYPHARLVCEEDEGAVLSSVENDDLALRAEADVRFDIVPEASVMLSCQQRHDAVCHYKHELETMT